MAQTTSLNFPYLFDVARNRVSVIEDTTSIVNRVRLLLLTEPTELYNDLDFGTGLRRYLWQYNTNNTVAQIQDRILLQLDKYEPCVVAKDTSFAEGLLFTGTVESAQNPDRLQMTVGLRTTFGDNVEISVADLYSSTRSQEG